MTITFVECVLGNCWHSQSGSHSWQTFLGINENRWFCLGCWCLTVGLEPILAFIEQELGYSLDKLPVYCRPSHPNTQILEKKMIVISIILNLSFEIRWPQMNGWCHSGHAPFIHSLLWEEQGLMLWTEKLLQGSTNLLFFSTKLGS